MNISILGSWRLSSVTSVVSQSAYLLTKTQRGEMFERPQVPLIDQLHCYGRELAVLKRMYQSYALIIERILDGPRPVGYATATPPAEDGGQTRQPSQGSRTATPASKSPHTMERAYSEDADTICVCLSPAATIRFGRLLDRINHLALSEIQECLDEKESLVFLVRFIHCPVAFTANTSSRISTS